MLDLLAHPLVRLFIALGLFGAGVLAFRLINLIILARARQAQLLRASAQEISPVSPSPEGAFPAILYFTTPDCAACKAFQRPQLRRLNALLGREMVVIEVDATQQPELASRWGVLSVPATFVLDPKGKARHVNFGAVPAEKLAEQVRRALAPG